MSVILDQEKERKTGGQHPDNHHTPWMSSAANWAFLSHLAHLETSAGGEFSLDQTAAAGERSVCAICGQHLPLTICGDALGPSLPQLPSCCPSV